MTAQKYILVFVGFLISFTTVRSLALDIPDRSFSEPTSNPEDFPATGFSYKTCSSKIPVRRGQNPWLRIDKKKSKPAAMSSEPPSVIESYFVTPGNAEKRFSIINQADSIYNSPTTLARIDCKNGLVYFQHLVREPGPTNFYRVYDLVSGEEYKVTEGAVTFSPKGNHMLTSSASEQDVKCGFAGHCEAVLKFYDCKNRKSKGSACRLEKEVNYSVKSKAGRAKLSVVPVKWKEKLKELKVIVGGSKQSPAKMTCELNQDWKCKVSNPGRLVFSESPSQKDR